MTPLSVQVVFYATSLRKIPREKSSMNVIPVFDLVLGARSRVNAPAPLLSEIDSNLLACTSSTGDFRGKSTKAGIMRQLACRPKASRKRPGQTSVLGFFQNWR